MNPKRDEVQLATVFAAGVGFVATTAAFASGGGRTAASVATGAIIAVVNLASLRMLVRAVLPSNDATVAGGARVAGAAGYVADREGDPAPGTGRVRRGYAIAWGLFGAAKMAGLFGGVFLLLRAGLVDPIALVVGYGALPVGITLAGLVAHLSPVPRS